SDALAQLYDLYKGLLFGLIMTVVKNREVAEDLLQEVFMKIWEKAPTFQQKKGNVYSWIVTLTRNQAIDHIRSKGYKTQQKASVTTESPSINLEGEYTDPLESTIFADRAKLVKKALKEIPKKQRKVLEIAYYQGFTQSEIATQLDIPLGTVKSRMRQGMMKLKDILGTVVQADE